MKIFWPVSWILNTLRSKFAAFGMQVCNAEKFHMSLVWKTIPQFCSSYVKPLSWISNRVITIVERKKVERTARNYFLNFAETRTKNKTEEETKKFETR